MRKKEYSYMLAVLLKLNDEPNLWWRGTALCNALKLRVVVVFTALGRLISRGYVESEFRKFDEFPEPLRAFRITEKGQEVLREIQADD